MRFGGVQGGAVRPVREERKECQRDIAGNCLRMNRRQMCGRFSLIWGEWHHVAIRAEARQLLGYRSQGPVNRST